jgi:hypothetical protein
VIVLFIVINDNTAGYAFEMFAALNQFLIYYKPQNAKWKKNKLKKPANRGGL